MAIAGLHNIAVFDSSLHRDSQSQVSRRRQDEGQQPTTRASSILQMWRDLEDENVVRRSEERRRERLRQQRIDRFHDNHSTISLSDNQAIEQIGGFRDLGESEYESEACSRSQTGSQNDNENAGYFGSEHSFNVSEVERERVRQIFREWKSNGGRAHEPGENESERNRIIREWVEMNSHRGEPINDVTEIQAVETGARIGRVNEGLVINDNEGRPNHSHRRIRRLCGRQALLDMVVKAERERQIELQGLSEYHAVSQFPHRNRIQSLLRGRFLRTERLNEDQRPTSTAAAGELGLLRRRHTVSGLREGFLSRLDNSALGQVTSSNSDNNTFINEETQEDNSQDTPVELHEQIETSNDGYPNHVIDLELNAIEDVIAAECGVEEDKTKDESTTSSSYGTNVNRLSDSIEDQEGNVVDDTNLQESSVQLESHEQFTHVEESDHEGNILDDINQQESYFQVESHEQQSTHDEEERNHEENVFDYLTSQESSVQVESNDDEDTHDDEDLQRLNTVPFSDWSGSSHDLTDEVSRQLGDLPDDLNELLLENDSPGSAENWVDEPYNVEEAALPVTRAGPLYIFDDDTAHNLELRDLLSRRRVSNLLQSSFRDSLNQLIQAYIDRQSNVPSDWDMDGMSPYPASGEQDPEEQTGDHNQVRFDANDNPPVRRPPPPPPPQPLWGQTQNSGRDNWSRQDTHHRAGIDWETINDLRIDMTRLQQRMNNMERMLEACMDMQLELQRSIRQEVSAALNRSNGSQECEDVSIDTSKWDFVRKGICCICCENNIDSLLYRCGHMCTCLNCANKLVQDRSKCPMCRAPVVEVIRAYSIA